MTDAVKSEYTIEKSYFSFWQVMAFILVFAFIGSWVLRTFAGAPEIKKFTTFNQAAGRIELVAEMSMKPADDLLVTNTCRQPGSKVSSSQTSGFSDWTLDSKTGYSGKVAFSVPVKQKCTAYIHTSKDTGSLANYSYISL